MSNPDNAIMDKPAVRPTERTFYHSWHGIIEITPDYGRPHASYGPPSDDRLSDFQKTHPTGFVPPILASEITSEVFQ